MRRRRSVNRRWGRESRRERERATGDHRVRSILATVVGTALALPTTDCRLGALQAVAVFSKRRRVNKFGSERSRAKPALSANCLSRLFWLFSSYYIVSRFVFVSVRQYILYIIFIFLTVFYCCSSNCNCNRKCQM